MASTNRQASRRLSILSTEEVDSLYGLPHFTEGERQIHFDLSPEEHETIDTSRTITAGVHLVLQLGYFKAKAQFFVVSLDHARPDIDHIVKRYFPGRLMSELKSRAWRDLTLAGFDDNTRRRWTRHGSTRHLFRDEEVAAAIHYTLDEQGDRMACFEENVLHTK